MSSHHGSIREATTTTPHDARGGDDHVLHAALFVVGAVPIGLALANGGTGGVSAAFGALLCLGVLSAAWREHAERRAARRKHGRERRDGES